MTQKAKPIAADDDLGTPGKTRQQAVVTVSRPPEKTKYETLGSGDPAKVQRERISFDTSGLQSMDSVFCYS